MRRLPYEGHALRRFGVATEQAQRQHGQLSDVPRRGAQFRQGRGKGGHRQAGAVHHVSRGPGQTIRQRENTRWPGRRCRPCPRRTGSPWPSSRGSRDAIAVTRSGSRTEKEIRELRKQGAGFGIASCDVCHTRHSFSVEEARQPQTCQVCHRGFDQPLWEIYSSSKHGIRNALKRDGTLPQDTPTPTCQDCHMKGGDHGVRTAWGWLAIRLPMPEDKEWAAARTTIMQALGMLDPKGEPTDEICAHQGVGSRAAHAGGLAERARQDDKDMSRMSSGRLRGPVYRERGPDDHGSGPPPGRGDPHRLRSLRR